MTELSIASLEPDDPASSARLTSAKDEGSDTFPRIFEGNADKVWRTLRALGVHEGSVDDALQDVFLTVHQKLPTFEGRSQLSTWIYGITYRVAQNYRRRIKKHAHEEVSVEAAGSGPDPHACAAQGQAAEFVEQFCLQLAESQRDVFVMCVLEGRSAPDVASLLGVPLNTVYSRVRSTRLRFHSELVRLQAETEGEQP